MLRSSTMIINMMKSKTKKKNVNVLGDGLGSNPLSVRSGIMSQKSSNKSYSLAKFEPTRKPARRVPQIVYNELNLMQKKKYRSQAQLYGFDMV